MLTFCLYIFIYIQKRGTNVPLLIIDTIMYWRLFIFFNRKVPQSSLLALRTLRTTTLH
jgi:hypothetical protein